MFYVDFLLVIHFHLLRHLNRTVYLHSQNGRDLRMIGAISIDLTGVLNENEANHLIDKEVKKRVK